MSGDAPLQLPARESDAHKGDFGRVLLIGGSRGMSGSIALSAIAALRTGAGLVTAAVPDRCLETVAAFHPCIMTVAAPDDGQGRFAIEAVSALRERSASVSAVGCGPGMTTEPGSMRLVEWLVDARETPRVLDADAINSLAEMQWSGAESGPLVLTPHPGELARLTGAAPNDRESQIRAADELAQRTGATIVVKGGPTKVVGPSGVWTNSTGNPGMATAGSGDVLTGIVAALLGQALSPWDAARLAVWLHGHAGDIAADLCGEAGMTAMDILDALPAALGAV